MHVLKVVKTINFSNKLNTRIHRKYRKCSKIYQKCKQKLLKVISRNKLCRLKWTLLSFTEFYSVWEMQKVICKDDLKVCCSSAQSLIQIEILTFNEILKYNEKPQNEGVSINFDIGI